jgi:DNA segregation ATPase FtsK/SpoIIIE-like protein
MNLQEFKDLEPLHAQAVEFASAEPSMCVSKMQRQFRIGYNRAARLCERLAEDGVLVFNRTTFSWKRAAHLSAGVAP